MSGNELERDLAADMPLSDEDAAAVVGGAIVKVYKLPGNKTITVDKRTVAGDTSFIFRNGTTTVTMGQARATVQAAGQTWVPLSTFMGGDVH